MDLNVKIKEVIEKQQTIINEINTMEKRKQDLIRESIKNEGELRAYKKIQEEEASKSE